MSMPVSRSHEEGKKKKKKKKRRPEDKLLTFQQAIAIIREALDPWNHDCVGLHLGRFSGIDPVSAVPSTSPVV